MNKLPTLYKRSSVGKILEWTIGTDGTTIVTNWGEKGGAIQETKDEIKQGKNLGRANATTAKEQAEAEAQSKWEKKLKGGWVKTIDSAAAGEVSDLITGGVWPLLAEKYRDYAEKIVWPAYLQPKLDGHRCIAIADEEGKVTLWSRKRKPISSMPHIVAALEEMLPKQLRAPQLAVPAPIMLDGELYVHNHPDGFESLSHFIRSSEPEPGHEVMQYHVYDVPILNESFSQRTMMVNLLLRLSGKVGNGAVRIVETRTVADEDEAMLAFEHFLELGYEGAMVRNAHGLYDYHPTHRSKDLLKIKKFDDAEFEVTGVKEGRGKLAGHAVFICKTKKNVEFEAKMKGALEKLKAFWDDPSLAVGRQMTVQYQGFTKYGKPRFPVAVRFREDA